VRAIIVARQGAVEALTYSEHPEPVAGAGEILVRVAAVGVNFRDVYERSGAYARETPFVPGWEAAGTIAALGPGVRGLAVGDPVAAVGVPRPGAYAERIAIAADRAVPLPPWISVETAAAVLLQGLTADYLAHQAHPIAPGDVAVVHAAAGGTGALLTQIGLLRGARVIGTVSNARKAAEVEGWGAEVVLRGERGFAAEVRRLTGGAGASVVFDSVGRETFEESLACLRPRGHLVLYGRSSGPVPPVDLHRLGPLGSLRVTVPVLPSFIETAGQLRTNAARLFAFVKDGSLKIRVAARYPLAEAGRAHAQLEARAATGKILLLTAPSDPVEGRARGSAHPTERVTSRPTACPNPETRRTHDDAA
jgi:NADPH:quinone reductase